MSCAVFAVPETSREIPPEPEKPGTVPGRIGRRAARNLGSEFRESDRLEKTLRIEVAGKARGKSQDVTLTLS